MPRPATLGDVTARSADGAFLLWALRGADGGASGLEFARSAVEVEDSLLVHAAPSVLDVEVFADGERLIAIGRGLRASEDTPMTRLTLDGGEVRREQVWLDETDLGSIVVLPGGEAGRLASWTTDPERRRWTWALELRGGET